MFSIVCMLIALQVFFPITAPIPAKDNLACKAALKEAVDYLNKLDRNEIRSMECCRLWTSIAELSTKLGDRDGAKKAIEKAKEAASELKGHDELRSIGQELGRLGEAAQVIELVAPVPGTGHPRDTILQEAAFTAAESGHYDAAVQIAKELSKESADWVGKDIKRLHLIYRSKSGVTTELQNEVDQLPTIYEKVVVLAGRSPLNHVWIDLDITKESIIEQEITAENFSSARAIAQRAMKYIPLIEDNQQRRYCIYQIARSFALLEDPESIRLAIKSFPSDPTEKGQEFSMAHLCKLKSLSLLAAAEARKKNDIAADQIVNEFQEKEDQAYVVMYIGLGQFKSGQQEKAKQSFVKARKMLGESSTNTTLHLHNLSSAESQCGYFEASLESAKVSRSGSSAYSNIAGMMGKAGKYDEARKIINEKVDTKWWQAMGLRDIACCQTKNGQEKEERKWIALETDQTRIAYSLVGLAEGLYRSIINK